VAAERRDGRPTAAVRRAETTLRQRLPERAIVDLAIVSTLELLATVGCAQLRGGLGLLGGLTGPARIGAASRLAHRVHADAGGTGVRTRGIDKATTPRSAICRNVNELVRFLCLARVN